jgi:hypothetical protein
MTKDLRGEPELPSDRLKIPLFASREPYCERYRFLVPREPVYRVQQSQPLRSPAELPHAVYPRGKLPDGRSRSSQPPLQAEILLLPQRPELRMRRVPLVWLRWNCTNRRMTHRSAWGHTKNARNHNCWPDK